MNADIQALAAELDDAVRAATAIPQLTAQSDLSLDDAYAVQAAGIRRRAERGDGPVGALLR